jgi:ABC-type sugar transport system permease subunit
MTLLAPESVAVSRENLSATASRTDIRWRDFRRHWFKLTFGIIIPFILYVIFIGYPILNTIYLSLFRWNGITVDKEFIGLDNYAAMLQDPSFRLPLINNLIWFGMTLVFPVIGGLVLAAILSSRRILFTKAFLVVMLLPITLSSVTVGTMFGLILNPVFGALNKALAFIGLGFLQSDWLGPNLALYTLITVSSWSFVGLTTIMFHAAMSQVPDELYETAKIEGARAIQTFYYVTLPMIRPVIAIVTILVGIGSLRAFDIVLVMTRGGPFKRTTVLGYLLWLETFSNLHFGYGAAIGTVILILSAAFIYFYIRQNAGDSLRSGA